jgi:glycerol kinase
MMNLILLEQGMSAYLLAIDQGTTSTRAIIFNERVEVMATHQIETRQFFPAPGWVEQDPEEIWQNTLTCCRQVLSLAKLSAKDISAAGITNQRETTVIWDKKTGEPVHPAIIWQDRRSATICENFSMHAINAQLQTKTGLLLDPYFSATKILWILENVPGVRVRAERNELVFGTIDTFLLWRFTYGQSHFTDATNASRTLLFNITTQSWDKDILDAFAIPSSMLPEVKDSAFHFGNIDATFFGAPIAVTAILGDQQAAAVGQGCFRAGMLKSTYGTGCFMLLNTGSQIVLSKHQLLTTVTYRLSGKITYGLEGSIFSAGATIHWLRDTLKLIHAAADTEAMAKLIPDTSGVYLVPAFNGLGAPYWDPTARAALLGLTSESRAEHIVRAALEAVCYQTRDLMECMQLDGVKDWEILHVDGGMAVNNWLLQFLSDILERDVVRAKYIETSALGAVFFAGLQAGIFASLDEISHLVRTDAHFKPAMPAAQREVLYSDWKKAVARVVTRS